MRKIFLPLVLILIFSCNRWNVSSKKPFRTIDEQAKIASKYIEIPNDPLKVKEYTLENGLKIFISENHDEPRIQTLVMVKAGSVNDPANATGLAHYLEHMLFKGNDKIGTINFEAEKIELNKIKLLFEDLRVAKDTILRKKIYHQIDSISGVAAKYSCPNEIDQLFTQIGAKGTNAFTSNEYTGYINDIPSNQLKNWLNIESQRYTNPVLRLFHTELEAVYEEKNISLDNADRTLYYEFMSTIFPTHNYGQQTTIGTIEHLKNPSMLEIEKFFNTYYVPNNMAIILSGDVNSDSAFFSIKEKFENYKSKPVKTYEFTPELPIEKPIVKELFSKEEEKLQIGFRFSGAASKNAMMITLVDMLLNNSTAGLMDININQTQKAVSSYSYTYQMKDYSVHILGGESNKGETLEDLKTLILNQIELLKKGEFPDWMLTAVVNDLKKRELIENRSNRQRVSKISDNFSKNIPWEKQVTYFDDLSKITKQEIIDFVTLNYKENYGIIYRRQKENNATIKVEKPNITPVNPSSENRSEFLVDFAKKNNPTPIKPNFIKYSDLITHEFLKDSLELLYQKNNDNDLFNLSLIAPFGTDHLVYLSLAADYLSLLGTKNYSLKQLNEKWYQLGLDFDVTVKEEETYFSLSGLSENFKEGLALMMEVLNNVKGDSATLIALKNNVLQVRENSLQDKKQLLWTGLKNHLVYDNKSPLKRAISNADVEKVSSEKLCETLNLVAKGVNRVTYFGPNELTISKQLLAELPSPTPIQEIVKAKYDRVATQNKNEIFVYDFDMQQAEILMMCKKSAFDKKNLPIIALFNEYFGGGMSSIVFQEIREKKALAYSVYAGYSGVKDQKDPHYVLAYIGTQADKFEESIQAMTNLLNNMPLDSVKFSQAKEALKQQYASKRIPNHAVIGSYLNDSKIAYNYDSTKDLYEAIDGLTLGDVKSFFNQNIKNNNFRIAILGNRKILKPEVLKKYGDVIYLTSKDLFPY